jgi:hypothetical protein
MQTIVELSLAYKMIDELDKMTLEQTEGEGEGVLTT